MPKVEASRELLAPQDDVWAFLTEPHNLPDWWPGLSGVQPDRRGVAPGARWQAVGDNRPTWFRRPNASGMLLIRAVEPPRHLAWHFTGDRIDVDLRLEAAGRDRTLATLVIEGPYLIGLRRSLPQKALSRLYTLCQTAAEP
jgi:uncharacterized protein YndB with AHSA1/START domain